MRRTDIINALIAQGYKAEKKDNIKNGVIFEGITIRSDEAIAPVIYTQQLIDDAETHGKSLAEVVAEIIRVYEESRNTDFSIEALKDLDFVLSHLYIGLQKSSDEMLVKRESGYEGIEAYLYVRGDNENTTQEGTYSVKVDEHYLSVLGLSGEDAWKAAEQNTFEETVIDSMAKVMAELCGMPYDPSMETSMPMYVVSNRVKTKGAGAILNKDALKEFGKHHGTSKLVVLPSSIHEMLILPYDPDSLDLREMSQMVEQINDAEVAPEERLTDRAYLIEV